MHWRTRNQIIVGVVILLILVILGGSSYFIFFRERPTCLDGKQNGVETGVDCGGICAVVCPNEAVPLSVAFVKSFEVSPGFYNAVALLENKNTFAGSDSFSYKITLSDSDGVIAERTGTLSVPVSSQFGVFEGTINTNGRVPADTKIEITKVPVWRNDIEREPKLLITSEAVSRELSVPTINATVKNEEAFDIGKSGFIAIVYDDEGNPIASSRTVTNDIKGGESKSIVFTWPVGYDLGSRICGLDSNNKIGSYVGDMALVLDRSGSMEFEGKNPPQPLTKVKDAAISMLNFLGLNDRVSIVSFGNQASVDKTIDNNIDEAKNAVGDISIMKDGTQNTNLADGILKAYEELTSVETSPDLKKSMIVLTDGVATRPLSSDDPDYPERYAKQIADQARSENVDIYTIGLGKDIKESYLRSISKNEDSYYSAPTADDLDKIYREIAVSICRKRPAIVKIIPQTL